MSIWNDCKETDSKPFYGFPIQINIKDNKLLVNFPKGYKPNGNKIQEVANKFSCLLGKIEKLNKNSFIIEIENNKLANFIYHAQFKFKFNDSAEYKITIGNYQF